MPIAADLYYFVHNAELEIRTPIVLIHGAGGNHLYWPPDTRRLSGYRIYALDLPGHGKSGGLGCQSVAAYAKRVMNWMDTMKIQKAVLVGHSMGGAIAMTIASESAERVLGLSLVSTGGRLRVAKQILDNSLNLATFPSAVDMIISLAFSESANERLVNLAAKRMLEVRSSVFHGDMLACDKFDMRNSLSKITSTTEVICGDMDALTPLRFSQYLAAQIPRAHLTVIHDAGHMVMLEKPRKFTSILVSFIDQLL